MVLVMMYNLPIRTTQRIEMWNREKKDPDFSQDKYVSDVYREYRLPLKGFVSRRVKSEADAEDILQNVFYKLSKLDLMENPIEEISGWLYSVARNQIIDRSRKKREEELPYAKNENDELVFIQEVTDMLLEVNTPETEFIKSVVWDELDLALLDLPEEQRVVFVLTELEGFSFNEVSEMLRININTLLSRKRYAVLYLRKRLLEVYEDLMMN